MEDYGTSEWVDDASFGVAMCYYTASRPPDYDQTNSQLAVRAIDEFKGKFASDARAKDLEGKRGEMREKMAESQLRTASYYVKRREFLSARVYYETIEKDYSDTSAAATAKAWLDANPGAPKMREKAAAK